MAHEFGVDTFGDVTVDLQGNLVPYAQVIRNVVAEAVRADQLGLDYFGIGEHHREDFAISAPDVVLAAIAPQTERIHLGTAVTVLSSDDPVRVFERFSTLNALSNGRAEVMLGRGSFTESFPLFGFDLRQYTELFNEKLDLFVELLKGGPVTWQGTLRPSFSDLEVFPRIEDGQQLRTWVAVGGNPESVIRAAEKGLPLVLAIIGGATAHFAPLADLYRRALQHFDQPEQPIAYHSPGYIAASDEQAREEYFSHYAAMSARIGQERGWPPLTREAFEAECEPEGAMVVGSPETCAAKIAAGLTVLGASRFDLKISSGTLPHEKILDCIDLYAGQVVPAVREALGS